MGKKIYGEKLVISRKIDGSRTLTTFHLDKHSVGHPAEWWAIIPVMRDGKSLANAWGGYNARNVGQPKYIQRLWNSLSRCGV